MSQITPSVQQTSIPKGLLPTDNSPKLNARLLQDMKLLIGTQTIYHGCRVSGLLSLSEIQASS